MACEFSLEARILSSDGTTVLHELEDEANGFIVLDEIGEPEWDEETGRVRSPYMHGSAPSRLATIIDGTLPVRVAVSGSTWPVMMGRFEALRTAWKAEPSFYFEHVAQGVTTRYRAERETFAAAPITPAAMAANEREVVLVFRVQPNPVVTV